MLYPKYHLRPVRVQRETSAELVPLSPDVQTVKSVHFALAEREVSRPVGGADYPSSSSTSPSISGSGQAVLVSSFSFRQPTTAEQAPLLPTASSNVPIPTTLGYGTVQACQRDGIFHSLPSSIPGYFSPAATITTTTTTTATKNPTPANLESGLHTPFSTLAFALSHDNANRTLLYRSQQQQQLHEEQGRPWLLTNFLWRVLEPKVRKQYEPMGGLERAIFAAMCLLLALVIGAAAWGIWGAWATGRFREWMASVVG